MKAGISLQELATEVKRQQSAKSDFVSDTKLLKFGQLGSSLKLHITGHGHYDIGDFAHRQIADHIEVPMKYYERMKAEAPALLAENVNYWFQNLPDRRFVRTLDGKARAFLSNRFRPLDNHDLAEAVLPTVASTGAKVRSCHIMEDRMYLKAVMEQVEATVPAPEGISGRRRYQNKVTVSPGIVIANSEIGHGALAIRPAVHFQPCLNLAVWAAQSLRKHHIGRKLGDDSDMEQVEAIVPAPEGIAGRRRHQKEVKVSPGIVIANSEIGHGALAIRPAVHFQPCRNLAVWAAQSLRKHHVGRKLGDDSEVAPGVSEYIPDDTEKLADQALWSQANDLIKGALAGDVFENAVKELRAARSQIIKQGHNEVVVEKLSRNKGLSKSEGTGVLQYLINGGDLTKFGLSNAVTRFSQDVPSYDRASFLEQVGGDVITLSNKDWQAMMN